MKKAAKIKFGGSWPKVILVLAFVSLFAIIGVSYLVFSHAATPVDADLNNDGVVDQTDVGILKSHWNQTGTSVAGDLNSDNRVNIFDLSIMAGVYGGTITPPYTPPFLIGASTIEDGGNNSAERRDNITKIQGMGATWVRINLVWKQIQPSAPAGYLDGSGNPIISKFQNLANCNTAGWNLGGYDDYINQLRSNGIDVLVTVSGVPAWAAGANSKEPDNDVFRCSMRAIAAHYRGRVLGYQIFNEVNSGTNWPDGAVSYVATLKAAYEAVKDAAGDSSARVVTSGLGYDGQPASKDGTPTAWEYLSQMYAAGAKSYYDVLAIHLYPLWCGVGNDCQDLGGYITNLRNVMVSNGDSSKQVWVTEHGHSTNTGHPYQEQVDYAKLYLPIIARYKSYIFRVVWYEVNDHYQTETTTWTHADNLAEKEYNFGVYDVDGTPKPVRQVLLDFETGNLVP